MGGLPALVGASASRDGQAVPGTPLGHVSRKSRKNQKLEGGLSGIHPQHFHVFESRRNK